MKLTVLRVFTRPFCWLIAFAAIAVSATSATSNGLGNDVIYSIIIDRFSSGNHENDVPHYAFLGDTNYKRHNRYWLHKMHYRNGVTDKSGVDFNAYWGGDLQGVVNKLDYLHYLGVTTILLSPVFENVNGYHYTLGGTAYHGYWTKDFMRLEEHFTNPPKAGETLEEVLSDGVLLKGLIDKAHSYDPPMKVLLDVALNHTSPAPIDTTVFDDNNHLEMGVLYDDGDYVSIPCVLVGGRSCRETSVNDGWFHPPEKWVDWDNPETWHSGYLNGNLADLDQRNPEVRDYLLRALRKWLALGVDGFRLDAVKNIYPEFLVDLEAKLRAEKPDIILIGEYFDGGIFEKGLSPSKLAPSIEWLNRFNHTTMFNFSFATSVREYFSGKKDGLGTPYILSHIIDPASSKNPLKSRSNELVTFINNHDIPRYLSLENASPKGYQAALKLLFAAPGVPKLLNGDEIGLAYYDKNEHWSSQSKDNPAWSRLFMPWEKFDEPLPEKLLLLTRKLIRMRKDHYFLKSGDIAFLDALNLINLVDRNSYIAFQRSEHAEPAEDTLIYLFSSTDRLELQFKAALPDGTYPSLDGSASVRVKDGVLTWTDVKAYDAILVGSGIGDQDEGSL